MFFPFSGFMGNFSNYGWSNQLNFLLSFTIFCSQKGKPDTRQPELALVTLHPNVPYLVYYLTLSDSTCFISG